MKLALEHPELWVVSDQRGSPTHAGDLASAIKQILGTNLKGVVHATGAGDCTWYEFAREIVFLMGSTALVQPISAEESKRAAQRPLYTVLSNRVLADAGISLPHWKDALGRFVIECKTVRSSMFDVPEPRTENLEPRTEAKT
jgi:dTDP-4-dehydrorhamnose reductase